MRKRLSILALGISAALGGCANVATSSAPPHPWQIPSDAKIIGDGKPPMSAAILGPGTFYIIDENGNALVQTTTLPPNAAALIRIDAEHGISVADASNSKPGDATVLLDKVNPDHRYSMWFAATTPGAISEPTTMPSR